MNVSIVFTGEKKISPPPLIPGTPGPELDPDPEPGSEPDLDPPINPEPASNPDVGPLVPDPA